MTLFVNNITIPSPFFSSTSAADVEKKGTQIPPRTLRERRGVTWFIRIEACTLVGANDDGGLAQPKGHLQPTVMNIPRRRRAPAPIVHIPTPLSSPATTSSAVADREGTQIFRSPCEQSGETMRVNFNRAKIEEWRRGVMSPEGQLGDPLPEECSLSETLSPVPLVSTPLFSPRTPPSDSANSVAELNGKSLARNLRDRRGFTLFIHFESHKLNGWAKQRGPQPKGHLEPTVANLPRRHKREVYGPMVHSRLPCNFY
ncbi:hypothetical protein C0993_005418 [Termitomyces sp. T159_Od127]|nr:hypothetical protein C0993_005418 [Termitomyces sp. T159_Od127]